MMSYNSNNSWPMAPAQPAADVHSTIGGENYGPPSRPMGLKVLYTFDRDSQQQCLARWPHTLQIPAIPLNENTSIGIVELRTCLQAVAQGSPEIVNQQDVDYTVYAYDYSEPSVPLAGQGMLSRGLDPNNDPHSQQRLTGRVTQNLLALFGNGLRETLEVRLKLTAVPRVHRPEMPNNNFDHQNTIRPTPTPVDTANNEWTSLIQANPALSRGMNIGSMPSPSLTPSQATHFLPENRDPEIRREGSPPRPVRPMSRPGSAPLPVAAPVTTKAPAVGEAGVTQPQLLPKPQPPSQPQKLGPQGPFSDSGLEKPSRPSRPSSRSSRSRQPTGRPRGRPRKLDKNSEMGNTSAAEEATDAEEGPQKKRAKVTQAEYNNAAPFGSVPDSLRVTASTSGSLRNMRPVGAAGDMPVGGHLQDVPRAPTPVPDAPLVQKLQRKAVSTNVRRDSLADSEMAMAFQARFGTSGMQPNMGQDARSPTESIGMSPNQGYTPDQESPADLGSSPPVPRTAAYMASSPMPSSPVLPPLPRPVPQVDSGFMSGGVDDFLDDEDAGQELPPSLPEKADEAVSAAPKPPAKKPSKSKKSTTRAPKKSPESFPFEEVQPGPPELLPSTSIFKPAGKTKSLNRSVDASSAHAPKKAGGSRSLKRSNTAPNFIRSEPEVPLPRSQPQQNGGVTHDNFMPLRLSPTHTEPLQPGPYPELSFSQLDASVVEGPPPASPQRELLSEIAIPDAPAIEETRSDQQQPPQPPQPPSTIELGSIPPADDSVPDLPQQQQVPDPSPSPKAEPESSMAPAAVMADAVVDPIEQSLLEALLPVYSACSQEEITESSTQHGSKSPPRARSQDAITLPVPASDAALEIGLSLPRPFMSEAPNEPAVEPVSTLPRVSMSEAPLPLLPPSDIDEPPRYNKNLVKKQSIKDRLENAIEKGMPPPFCNNCGAIETPTWRKVWTQEVPGIPAFHELSAEPGCVTAIDILNRDDKGQPSLHRLVKKTLGQTDDKRLWAESLLCNPCGIWLSKFRGHRPPERWDKDASRLNQPRKKRESKGGGSRSKKARSNNDAQLNPTSEAYLVTDPLGPGDQESPNDAEADATQSNAQDGAPDVNGGGQVEHPRGFASNRRGSPKQQGPGPASSRGSGTTTDSPADMEDGLGTTRRLLFPSPRKDGVPKVLGELAVNVVHTAPDYPGSKSAATLGKENIDPVPSRATTPALLAKDTDLEQELFGTPPVRPSTPPPKAANSGPFKTPTRPTPSHRPITRSISRSIRSARSIPKSPSQAILLLQGTPSRTPRSSAKRRSSPRNSAQHAHAHAHAHAHFTIEESPFTATLHQLLSEANDFTAGSPSHGLLDLDLSSLPNIDSDGVQQHLANTEALDFSTFLSDAMVMPSSPPQLRGHGGSGMGDLNFGDSLDSDLWGDLDPSGAMLGGGEEKEDSRDTEA